MLRRYVGRVNLVQWLPALAGLGIGGVIVGWAGAGNARREVRSAVLQSLAVTENARWCGLAEPNDFRHFRSAIHELETAALIARIPRRAVQHYAVFADAARRLSDESYEERDGDEDMGAGGIDGIFARTVQQSAEIITQLAWRPWWARLRYRADLKRLRDNIAMTAEPDVTRQLASVQYSRGRLPSPLGEMVDKQFPHA